MSCFGCVGLKERNEKVPSGSKGQIFLPGFMYGLKSLREKQPIAKSVPQGRLSLAQDAVLGWHAPLKSPAGATEKVIETWSWIRGADHEF
jgi:hypothetical protein